MQAIRYSIVNYSGFGTVEENRFTAERTPQEFADLLRVFSDRRPHLLDGEQVKAACLSGVQGSYKPARLSRDCFSVDVSRIGIVSVFCQYTTTHKDGDRLHDYLLTAYPD